jgi:Patatin-like phospholipase
MRKSLVVTMALSLGLCGCTSAPTRLPAVPAEHTATAEIPGMPGVRYPAGGDATAFARLVLEEARLEREAFTKQGGKGPLPPAAFLTISGGGDNGAYTAGVLNGWTAAGTRPQFKGVTGISTGALIAPFAFLGPKYDPTLKQVYTTITPKDIYEARSLLGGLMSDAMADSAPLWRLTRKSITEDVLKEIAAEYAKGRLLLVATGDLDARRPIIWDMGKIASYGGPAAVELFISVMIASASLPGAFPPTMIDVEAAGKRYQEMHVDGGVMAQVFAYPPAIHAADMAAVTGARERRLYLIRNSRLVPDWENVERKTMAIAGRAVASLIHTQGLGDLIRIYATARRDGVDFNLTYIPTSFHVPHREEFDNDYMVKLYQLGYDLAAKGMQWAKAPPGLEPASK